MTVRPGSRPTHDRHDAPAVPRPQDLVATVAGKGITCEQVDRRLADMRRGPRARHIPPDVAGGSADVRRWVVQELVTEAVLAHEIRAAGIAPASEAARPSPTDVESLAARVTADTAVPETDVRGYYERNPDLYRRPEARRVRHFLVADEATARETARRVAAGDDDASGLELRDVRRGELAGALEAAIFGADVGAVVGPIGTELGWHVARIDADMPASVTPFAEARAAIEADLLVAARTRVFDEWLDRRRRALVVIEPGFEHPGHPIHGVPSHRH